MRAVVTDSAKEERMPKTVWEQVHQHITAREHATKPIDRLAKGLEFILAARFSADPKVTVNRFADEFEVLLRQAYGDDPNNELRADQEAAKGTLPLARSGRSDPTASQAEARIRLRQVEDALRDFADRHGIEITDEHEGPEDQPCTRRRCKVCVSQHRSTIDQLFDDGWTLDQVAREVKSINALLVAMGLQAEEISRATLGRHRKHVAEQAPAAAPPSAQPPSQAPEEPVSQPDVSLPADSAEA